MPHYTCFVSTMEVYIFRVTLVGGYANQKAQNNCFVKYDIVIFIVNT